MKIQHLKFKKLRNRVNSLIKKDVIQFNDNRIENAKDEKEIWKVVKEITTTKSSSNWSLIENGEVIKNEEQIADIFNDFFISKIKDLKDNIDTTIAEDPIGILEEKMKLKNLKFCFKEVTTKEVLKTMADMKSKKSSGTDGLTQEHMKHGADVIAGPLTKIINESMKTGKFPEKWKEAIVTPILKKGSPQDKSNYRPVSCLIYSAKKGIKEYCKTLPI